MKKIFIDESKICLLKEGISKVLYHFTSLNHGFKICMDDRIYLQSSYAKDSDNYDDKRKFYLSCTRIRNSQFGYSKKFSQGGVRIELDGDALATRFKGKQVNYWGGGVFTDKYTYMRNVENDRKTDDFNKSYQYPLRRFKKDNPNASEDEINNFVSHNFNDDAQHHVSNESEDRILSYEPLIIDAHKYIKSIDVLLIDFENDPNKMEMAQSFKFKTSLGRIVRIFDSEKEFNSPNGKDANDKIKYGYGKIETDRSTYSRIKDCLEGVICFIAYVNPQFDKKNFGKAVMQLLSKYDLSEFRGEIGKISDRLNRYCSAQIIAEHLDSVRRYLSDDPNEYTYKISKMLTDYMLSIGAKTFREGYLIKKQMEEEYCNFLYGKVYDRINTSEKYTFLVFNRHIISLNPKVDKFRDAVGWNDDELKGYADSFASEAMYEKDKYNTSGSKNYNSMFQYLYKLFRKGSIEEVYSILKKIGFDDEFLSSWNINIQFKEMDYWDAVRCDTVTTHKLRQSGDYDYAQVSRLNDKEIEQCIKKIQKVQQ